jgi:hypothetical protein
VVAEATIKSPEEEAEVVDIIKMDVNLLNKLRLKLTTVTSLLFQMDPLAINKQSETKHRRVQVRNKKYLSHV